MERDVAELLAAIAGPELAYVNDAIERLSLYVGAGAPIDEAAVAECVARVRTADTWALVDAVGKRDLGRAFRILADVYDPRDRGLPLLGRAGVVDPSAGEVPGRDRRRGRSPTRRRARRGSSSRSARASWRRRRAASGRRRWSDGSWCSAETDVALKSSRRAAGRDPRGHADAHVRSRGAPGVLALQPRRAAGDTAFETGIQPACGDRTALAADSCQNAPPFDEAPGRP